MPNQDETVLHTKLHMESFHQLLHLQINLATDTHVKTIADGLESGL